MKLDDLEVALASLLTDTCAESPRIEGEALPRKY